MKKAKTETPMLKLTPEIIKQSNAFLDCSDQMDVEHNVLMGLWAKQKFVPSDFKGIYSAGGRAYVHDVLLPRFVADVGQDFADQVFDTKYKQEVVLAHGSTSKTVKAWKNSAIETPLSRLGKKYASYLGSRDIPLHESANGKLVQIPTGTNAGRAPRNEVPEISHPAVRQFVKLSQTQLRILTDKVKADKADMTDRACIQACDWVLDKFKGHIPSTGKSKK